MRIILPEQIQAARALLGWSQSDLAKKAGSSRATVHRMETHGAVAAESNTALKIALERGGIHFIAAKHGKGPGVWIKRRVKKSEHYSTLAPPRRRKLNRRWG